MHSRCRRPTRSLGGSPRGSRATSGREGAADRNRTLPSHDLYSYPGRSGNPEEFGERRFGAVLGTLGGAAVRAKLAQAFGRDLPAALIEDVVAIGGALAIVCMASR